MSFFHLKYANAESQILNLDVRSSILCDYFHKVILSRATEYVHTKSSAVMEGIEETKLNLTHLKDTIASIGVTALNVNSDDGTAIEIDDRFEEDVMEVWNYEVSVERKKGNMILFINEMHTVMGAGDSES